jgi:hypothetical protein
MASAFRRISSNPAQAGPNVCPTGLRYMISSYALQAVRPERRYRCRQNTNRTAICITLGVRVVITWPNRVFT